MKKFWIRCQNRKFCFLETTEMIEPIFLLESCIEGYLNRLIIWFWSKNPVWSQWELTISGQQKTPSQFNQNYAGIMYEYSVYGHLHSLLFEWHLSQNKVCLRTMLVDVIRTHATVRFRQRSCLVMVDFSFSMFNSETSSHLAFLNSHSMLPWYFCHVSCMKMARLRLLKSIWFIMTIILFTANDKGVQETESIFWESYCWYKQNGNVNGG
jgi:hypothetical protein